MKKSANSNMYAVAAERIWRDFGAHLSGNPLGLWCVVSEQPLGEAARQALSSSAAALGFGEDACTFVALEVGGRLEDNDLFLVVEGVDPLCVVAADAASAKALAAAYRQDVPVDARCRLFGRDAVTFRQFEALLDDSAHKQKAWALLKQLPRLD